jgi:hypothetical protein
MGHLTRDRDGTKRYEDDDRNESVLVKPEGDWICEHCGWPGDKGELDDRTGKPALVWYCETGDPYCSQKCIDQDVAARRARRAEMLR